MGEKKGVFRPGLLFLCLSDFQLVEKLLPVALLSLALLLVYTVPWHFILETKDNKHLKTLLIVHRKRKWEGGGLKNQGVWQQGMVCHRHSMYFNCYIIKTAHSQIGY